MSLMVPRTSTDPPASSPKPGAPRPPGALNRRGFLGVMAGAGAALLAAGCTRMGLREVETEVPELLPRSEWRSILPPERYRVLFEEHTEPAFSSPLDKLYDPGTYVCAACFQPLFSSETKYDSRTGWPSFWTHLPDAVGTKPDYSFFMRRTECHCSRCGGHQGHVFSDGPQPTGERWCINGLALEFVAEGTPLPELRPAARQVTHGAPGAWNPRGGDLAPLRSVSAPRLPS
jgi:peptide-methionine (R)-S-oxide reductase